MAYFFQMGWNIKINDLNKDMHHRIEDLGYKQQNIEDMPILNGDSYIDEIKFDLKNYLNRISFPSFKVPKDLEFNIIRNNNTEILLNLKVK